MIEIKKTEDCDAVMTIKEGTPCKTILLGIEMLIETLLEILPTMTVDDILDDVKRIYLRDNVSNRKEVEK